MFRSRWYVACGTQANCPNSTVRWTSRLRVERPIPAVVAASRRVVPFRTASTARKLRRKWSRCFSSRRESSKVESPSVGFSACSSSKSTGGARDKAGPSLLSSTLGSGSGRIGEKSGARQINGVSRVNWIWARSTRRCPPAAASAHVFQTAASFSAGGQRSPKRATISWTQAASP